MDSKVIAAYFGAEEQVLDQRQGSYNVRFSEMITGGSEPLRNLAWIPGRLLASNILANGLFEARERVARTLGVSRVDGP